MAEREITGRMVFFITASAFAVIIAVNVFMATQAVRTFPGLEVKNSYVASQQFDSRRAAQEALGWRVGSDYDGRVLTLRVTDAEGRAVDLDDLSVLIGRTTEARDDIRPEFTGSRGAYSAPVQLMVGKWMMRVEATAPDGTPFLQRLEIRVKG